MFFVAGCDTILVVEVLLKLFQTYGEMMKNIDGIMPKIFDVFNLSMQPIFHLEKEN